MRVTSAPLPSPSRQLLILLAIGAVIVVTYIPILLAEHICRLGTMILNSVRNDRSMDYRKVITEGHRRRV